MPNEYDKIYTNSINSMFADMAAREYERAIYKQKVEVPWFDPEPKPKAKPSPNKNPRILDRLLLLCN